MSNAEAEIQIVEIAASELAYSPTYDQRRAKAAFWMRFAENPLCEPSQISLATASILVSEERLSRWWSSPGFRQWFINQEEFRERLEFLAGIALDRLQSILLDDRANPSAQVSATRMLLEAARKMPQKHSVEKYLDEQIAQMNKYQLQEFISRKMRSLPPVTTEEKEE